MVHITTPAQQAKHERTSRDVYFESLEEAYGNLPVPSDDYADIKQLLVDYNLKTLGISEGQRPIQEGLVQEELDKLQEATEIIQAHYEKVGKALGVSLKYA